MSLESFQAELQAAKAELEGMKAEAPAEAVAEAPAEAQVEAKAEPEAPREYTEIEKKAIEQGWKPDHKGESFVDAEEFVKRGSFFKKIETQNKKIDDLTDTVKELLNHNKKLEAATYERAMKEFARQREQAVMDGDVEAFRLAEEKISQQAALKAPEVKPIPPETIQELSEFKEKNKTWFAQKDAESAAMTRLAVAYEQFEAQENPHKSAAQVLKEIDELVRFKYPHRFENVNKEKPAMVTRSSATSSDAKSSLASRLNDRQRAIFNQAKQIDPSINIETYAKQLDIRGDLRNE